MARSPEEGANELHNGAEGGNTVRLEQNDSTCLDGGATAGLINRSVRESEDEGTLATEIPTLVRLSVPMIAQNLCGFGLQTVGIIFISRLGVAQLSAAVLANSIFNVTGFSVLLGILGAQDTSCGQAYGAENYRMLGVVTQRAIVISLVFAVPVIIGWTQVDSLMLLLGQAPVIVHRAKHYLLMMSPSLPIQLVGESCSKFQTTQNIVMPSALIAGGTIVAATPLFYVLTGVLPWGLTGAAVAFNTANLFAMIAILIWTFVIVKCAAPGDSKKQSWQGFTPEAFQGWGPYLSLGVGASMMVCLEWWLFEIANMLSGILPNPETALSVTGVCSQVIALAFMVPLGVCSGLRIRVSNLLGAGKPKAALSTVKVATCMGWVLVLVYLAILIPGDSWLGTVFFPHEAPDSKTRKTLRECIWLVAAGAVGDWTNCVLSGALQGTGRQMRGAQIYAFTHWCVGPFLLWLLPFHFGLGVQGIWATLAVISNLQVFFMSAAVWCIDWDDEARRAAELTETDNYTEPSSMRNREPCEAQEPLLT